MQNAKPDLIKASRKRRIAAGSGTTVQDVNKLLKQYQEMTRMMKKMKKMGKKGLTRSGMPGMIPRHAAGTRYEITTERNT